MKVEISFDLYKESGKWAYGGICEIDDSIKPWETESLLKEIDNNQNEIIKGIITNRHYFLVIKETERQSNDPEYQGFYQKLVFPKPQVTYE